MAVHLMAQRALATKPPEEVVVVSSTMVSHRPCRVQESDGFMPGHDVGG